MRSLLILILSFLLCVSATKAQNPVVSPTPEADDEGCALPIPELVTLNVSVWSKNKGYLKDLTYKDFEIFDGKEKQPIEYFIQKDEPASIGILFDLSDSMQNSQKISEIPLAVEGLISFINAGNPKNEYFIVGFARENTVLLEPTQDKMQIESALKTLESIKPEGNTGLYDAMSKGFEKISSGKFDKKILLVISDGMDTDSRKTNFADIKKLSKESNAMIYLVNSIFDEMFEESLTRQSGLFFRTLTTNSGGRIFSPRNRRQIIETFETLAEELKSQYKIGFTPPSSISVKKDWRELKVNLNLSKEKKAELGKVSVRAQKGFYF